MQLDRELFKDVSVRPIARLKPDVFGLEIELEGRGLAMPDISPFTLHTDNSLRTFREDAQALEYVFAEPLPYDETIAAIKKLFDYLNSEKAEVFDSYRTSIHVHLNFGLETYRTIYNLVTLSIIFDELFVSQNGRHRIGNNFCLRAKDAQNQVNHLVHLISNGHKIWEVNPDSRYSSVNFASLGKFGTVEYRSMECTTNLRRVQHWIDTLQALKVSSRTFEHPGIIIGNFSGFSKEEFVRQILGPCADFYLSVPGWEDMLHNGMRLAQDFAFCSEWKNVKPEERLRKSSSFTEHMQQIAALQQTISIQTLNNISWETMPNPDPGF